MNQQTNENHNRKSYKRLCRIMASSFALIIFLCTIISLLLPDKSFSDEENRVLAKFPELTGEAVMNKDYMTELESYTSDQFFARDLWIRLKVQCDLLMGKREFNGVYLGKDKYLMQIPQTPDEENLDNNLNAMDAFANANDSLNTHIMLVPNAVYTMREYLPGGAPVRNQNKDIQNVFSRLDNSMNCIDVTKTLQKHADEEIYYKTDHHWTSKGAAYAFSAAAEQLGIENPQTSYDVYTVSTDFSGTLASKSGYHKAVDTIEIYTPKDMETQYLVRDSDNREKRPTLYDKSALKEKDKYQVFFGGNHAEVDIVTTNNTEKKLLIFKDSYANCFVPFLLPYYHEIIMIDPRYYYEDVQNLIEKKSITDILFLYNVDTFLNDNSIADVLEAK